MIKLPLAVNLFGGPGAGKSTTAAGVFSILKLHDVEVELVTEYAKDLVWEERMKTFEDQHYLFGKQHHRMWRLKTKVDVMITDSPLMLSVVYRPETLGQSFVDNVVDTVNTFNNYNILLTRTKRYNANGRNQNEDEARAIDRAVRKTLTEYKMGWKEVPGNFEGINMTAETILNMLGKEMWFKINNI